VHASRSIPARVRLYDRLFAVEQPDAEGDLLAALNPDSLAEAPEARTEPALARAEPGSRYQFLRQGYFFADPVDSRPGAPVWNRTIALKDAWTARGAAPRPGPRREPKPRREPASGPAAPRRSQADLLAADPAISSFYGSALAAHPARESVGRWLLNELLGLAGDRPLPSLPLSPAAFGRFVALADAGRLTPSAGKALLQDLVERGGEPEARMRELGLEKLEDRGAVEAAVARALEARAAEVARYRAGEKKLLGVLLGAAMRETGGAADAALVRQVLQERLG
jgi:hypothetical protein